MKLSSEMGPGASATLVLTFTIGNSISTQQLRGAIVYFTKDDEGSNDGKMDFRLCMKPTTFVIPTPITK